LKFLEIFEIDKYCIKINVDIILNILYI
jgi:hypothetical protein